MGRNTQSDCYTAAWRERLDRETAELDRALADARARAKDCAALLAAPELVRRAKREGVLLHGRPEVPASQG